MLQPIYIVADNIVSPLGMTTVANFAQMLAGRSGIVKTIVQGAMPIEVCAALVPDADIVQALPVIDPYTRFEKLLIISITDTLAKAGIDARSPRTAFVFSTTKGNIDMLHYGLYPDVPVGRIYLAQASRAISQYFGNPNTPIVISNACISGVAAVVIGTRMLRTGQYDHIVACGGDIVNDFTASGFQSFKALSSEHCKPYDKDRNGLNLGEAFGTVVLSAKPVAGGIRVLGGATSNDANHISGPSRDGSGLKLAIAAALNESEIAANEIGMVSAHGTATPYNDEMEAIALDDLGLGHTPVVGLKGYFGHTLGGAGLVETIISAQSIRQQTLIKTLGYENHGVSRSINITQHTEPHHFTTCLKIASGFGGCNAALILKQ